MILSPRHGVNRKRCMMLSEGEVGLKEAARTRLVNTKTLPVHARVPSAMQKHYKCAHENTAQSAHVQKESPSAQLLKVPCHFKRRWPSPPVERGLEI